MPSLRLFIAYWILHVLFIGCFSSYKAEKDAQKPIRDAAEDSTTITATEQDSSSVGANTGTGGGESPDVISSGANKPVGSVGITPGFETAGSQEDASVLELDEFCALMTIEFAELPIDIIIAIESTSGMKDEIASIQENLYTHLFKRLQDNTFDPSIIVLAATSENEQSQEYVCLDAPMGSGTCPDDSNPPVYYHIDRVIDEDNALEQLAAYPIYEPFLRKNAKKVFVVVSDGDAAFSPIDSSLPESRFIVAIEERPDIFEDWLFYGIYCQSECEFADAIGQVYANLVERTNGLSLDLCLQDFSLLFDELSADIAERPLFECRWSISDILEKNTTDKDKVSTSIVDIEGNKVILPRADAESECESHLAWYYPDYDNPTEIALCPKACQIVRQKPYPKLVLEFGCIGLPL